MTASRRQFLKRILALCAAFDAACWTSVVMAQNVSSRRQRVSDIIREYSAQGSHRSGTDVDNLSAHWMVERLAAMGVIAQLDAFEIRWADIEASGPAVIASDQREPTTAFNVSARIAGRDPALPPVVVMTPRSALWHAASERGGGIAAFLEIAYALSAQQAARDVIFIAHSGHEIGQLGLDHFLRHHAGLVNQAAVWIDLGDNFAARDTLVRLQYSDYELEELTELVLASQRLIPGIKTPIGSVPMGDVRQVFEGGGHFVSLMGSNRLYQQPDDRWPDAVDIENTYRWVEALTALAQALANH